MPAAEPGTLYHYGETNLHPVGLAAVLILGLLLLWLPRRYAMWPFIVMACFISPDQRIVIFSLNFDLLRVMVLFGSVRFLFRREWAGFKFNRLDRWILLWGAASAVCYILLRGDSASIKYRLGTLYDAWGMYFFFRCIVREWRDLSYAVLGFICVSVPVLGAFCVEHSTGHNVFAIFGGIYPMTVVRDGRLRCQGAFAHPILAGCFWSVLLPLIVAYGWQGRRHRLAAVVGTVSSVAVIFLCASSTPIAALIFAALGGIAFLIRRHMKLFRILLVVTIICLHLVMKAPVWQLVGRIDFAGGSTGWHRYELIDAAIHHFGDWWMLGTESTEAWGEGLFDVTNQFILEGVRGGILGLIGFLAILTTAFGMCGRAWRQERSRQNVAMSWALGVAMFVHVMNFIGVSYFGQIDMIWYFELAVIGSLSATKENPLVTAQKYVRNQSGRLFAARRTRDKRPQEHHVIGTFSDTASADSPVRFMSR